MQQTEIPLGDAIFRNLEPNIKVAVDYEKYMDNFLEGRRELHDLEFLNITDGYRLIQKFFMSDRNETSKAWAKRIREKYLNLYDILHGLGQPEIKQSMELNDVEKEQIFEEVTEKDKNGNVVNVLFQKLAQRIMKKYKFYYRAEFDEFLYYDANDGIYTYGASSFIAKLVREILSDKSTTHIVNEVVAYIRDVSLGSEIITSSDFINLKNGVLDWKNLRLLPHSEKYYFRAVLPFRYNFHSRKTRFFDVLEEITKDNTEKALKVMETYAWAFIPGYPIQKTVAFFGVGNNGKSVLLSFLYALLGKENISSTPLQTLCNNRFAVPGLRGKLMNIAGDVSDSTLYDTSIFKNLTGGDEVEGEIKGLQRRPKFVNEAKMLFAFNRLPNTWDQSRAYYRRFELIEFIQDFTGRNDPGLVKKITAESDLQAVFNMIVEIFLPVLSQKLGFFKQETIEQTTQRYKLNSNPALAFIDDMIEPNPDMEIEAKELYIKFLSWCEIKGITPVSSETLGRTLMKKSDIAVFHKLKQKDGVRSYYYVGVSIKDTNDQNAKKSDQVSDHVPKNLCTFREALKHYIESEWVKQSDHVEYVFCTPTTCSILHVLGVQKTYATYALRKPIDEKTTLITDSNSSDHVRELKNPNMITPSGNTENLRLSTMHDINTKINAGLYECNNSNVSNKSKADYIKVTILQDQSIAWTDQDWYLHKNDIVFLDPGLVNLLEQRGIARRLAF